jgi:uncharacterized RDD family membrane protein YckC
MNRSSDSKGLGRGVYYARAAYAGVLTRFLIMVIDLAAILAAGVALYLASRASYALAPENDDMMTVFLGSWSLVTYVYLVFVESSSIGTLGFLLAGMKIVNLKGERPSFVRMTFRLLLWVLGPFHPLIDLLWLSGDRDRQTLRDKFAGTYVVRKAAVPCGEGAIRSVHYFLFGFSILFLEVERPRAAAQVKRDGVSA